MVIGIAWKQMKLRNQLKYLIFSLTPAVALIALATVVMSFMEKENAVDLSRSDDRVAMPPIGLLTVETTQSGDFYKVQNNTMIASSFPVTKSDATYRIFVVGGSFAMGTPYVHQNGESAVLGYGGIPDWLRAELVLRFPTRKIEIINCGAGAQNSTRVYGIVRELLRARPDLFIVMTGNNEGYVPATRFNERLHRWIVYRALKRTILPEPNLWDRSYFSPQDKDTKKIEKHFQANIRRIIRVVKDNEVDLLLTTLPINLKYDHFDVDTHGQPTPFPADDERIAEGRKLHDLGEYTEAIRQYAASSNQTFASFYIARSLEMLGRFVEARKFYKIFVQHNPLNRIRPSFNDFIRRIGSEKDILIVDLEKTLEDSSANGIPSQNPFVDYCHMSWTGYQFMASRIADVLIDAGFIQGSRDEPLPKPDIKRMIEANKWQNILVQP
jgi:lysophospholipase L1-like esterase